MVGRGSIAQGSEQAEGSGEKVNCELSNNMRGRQRLCRNECSISERRAGVHMGRRADQEVTAAMSHAASPQNCVAPPAASHAPQFCVVEVKRSLPQSTV